VRVAGRESVRVYPSALLAVNSSPSSSSSFKLHGILTEPFSFNGSGREISLMESSSGRTKNFVALILDLIPAGSFNPPLEPSFMIVVLPQKMTYA